MRTHLLRTTYPIPTDVEPDTGIACNDACYDSAAQVIAEAFKYHIVRLHDPSGERIEEYELGGYAGI
jgi:hypothetical protein